MKTLHFALMLALVTMTTFACSGDDEGAAPSGGPRGEAGAAGASADADSASSAGNAGNGGDGSGGTPSTSEAGEGGRHDAFAGASTGGATEVGGAAGAGGEDSAPLPLEIVGEWIDNYGSDQIIDGTSWNTATIVAYDNTTNTVYAQNSPDDQYNPSKFTKTVYIEPENDSFYFCLIVYSAETLAAAQADTAVADATAPESAGCGSFPWSKATKP